MDAVEIVTDVGLKELASCKQTFRNWTLLTSWEVTDSGLKELVACKQLQIPEP